MRTRINNNKRRSGNKRSGVNYGSKRRRRTIVERKNTRKLSALRAYVYDEDTNLVWFFKVPWVYVSSVASSCI